MREAKSCNDDAGKEDRQARVSSPADEFSAEIYREFIENKVKAGTIGNYCAPGYPLYTADRRMLEMLGYGSVKELSEAIGGLLKNLIHPEDLDRIRRDTHLQANPGGRYSVSYRMKKSCGSYIWVEDDGKLFTAEDGSLVYMSVCVDITDRQNAMLRLNDQAEQLRLYHITEQAAAYRILADASFTLLYGNDRFFQMLGYTPESFKEKLKNSCLGYVHPDDRAMVAEKVRRAIEHDGEYTQWIMRVITGSGGIRYVQATGIFSKREDGLYVMEGVDIDVTEHKMLEKALYERSAMFENLLEHSRISLWTYDIATKTATLVSSKKHKRPMSFTGTADFPESIIASGFFRDSSVVELRRLMMRVDAGEATASADIWYDPQEGESWCEHVTYVNIFDGDGKIIRTIGMGEDVTEQRIAQQQFDEELNYQQTAQNDKLLVKVRCNLTRNIVESYIAAGSVGISHDDMPYDAGVGALAATGYTEEERQLISRMLDRQRVLKAFEQGEHFYQLDYRRKTHDGRVIWVNSSVKTYRNMQTGDIKSFMYTRNIDREKTSEQILSSIARTEFDYIMLVNLDTDEYSLYAERDKSPAMPPQGGSDFREMIRRVNGTISFEDDRARANRDLTPSVIRENLKRTPVFSSCYGGVYDGGVTFYKKIQYFWLDEESGRLILTRSDVTNETSAQLEQQKLLRSALAQAEKASSAKTDFLSKMSHEIRTPMNAIIGMNALAAQSINDPAAAGDCIAKVGISARYLLSLINDILDMSRIESGKVNLRSEVIPFEEFLHGINTIIYEQAVERGLSYDSIITGRVADSYIGDAMKLQQILVNLLGNAVKFTPEGGKVQLIVSQERTEKDRAYLKFIVNDTGIGISEEFQNVMFRPFEQASDGTTSQYGGTGLGLAITRNLVTLMGGTISVNSIVGVGTEFVVNVPLVMCEEELCRRMASHVNFSKMSALVVDDEILICEQARGLLSEMGMKAEWVESGRKAVALVRDKWKNGKSFDLILIDWKMPEMDGIETARQIRAIVGPDVTIIIITAYEWAEIEKEARNAGVNMLITKPLFRSSLISAFERVFTTRRDRLTPPRSVEYDFSGTRVLLVEDHLLNVEVAKRLLQSKGAEVEVAENGLAAIEAFTSNPDGHFDAILMDIRMPVMDGLTATRSIRQLKKRTARTIPIIAMSANAFEEDVEKSHQAGMDAHLSKPIEPQQLYATLYQHLSRKQGPAAAAPSAGHGAERT